MLKCKGYSEALNTWEPKESLECEQQLMEDFESLRDMWPKLEP